jgi:ribose/xylose/arabinose/galactoside ABC-type transport system permease subunit
VIKRGRIFINPGRFLELNRLNRMFRSASQTAVIGYGIALLMITAEFDLSVGSLYALTGGMAVFLMSDLGMGSPFAAVLILVFAFLYGISQGLMVTKLKLPSLIVTIGTLTLLRGALRVLTGGVTISSSREGHIFNYFGTDINLQNLPLIGSGEPLSLMSTVGPTNFAETGIRYQIPVVHSEPQLWTSFSVQIIWAIVLLLVFHYLLFYTRFGHHVRATGDNIESVDTTGIDPELIKIACFGIASVTAAFGVMMLFGRSLSISSATASGLELEVIAAVVLGGTKLTGGKGSMVGTALGALVFAAASTVLNLANLGLSGWQGVITGAFIVAAIGLDAVFRVVSLSSVRFAYFTPTAELIRSPKRFFEEKLPRKTTNDMFGYLVMSIFTVFTTMMVLTTLLEVDSIGQDALGIEDGDYQLFLEGGIIEAGVQVYFFLFLLTTLAFITLQVVFRAFGEAGDYETTIGVVSYSMVPAPLLIAPVVVFAYKFVIGGVIGSQQVDGQEVPTIVGQQVPLLTEFTGVAGQALLSALILLLPVLLLMLAVMYIGITTTRDLSRGQGLVAVGVTGLVWLLILGFMLERVAWIV